MRTTPLARSDDRFDLNSRFRELSENYCGILGRYGIPFRPYEEASLPSFSAQPEEQKRLILAALEESVAAAAEAESHGESVADSKRFLWRSLSRMKMTPRPELLDRIEDGDVVQVFLSNYHQIYRDISFFRYFSCTLEELVSFPIWQLAKYPPETWSTLDALMQKLKAGELRETFSPPMPPYVIEEIAGIEKLKVEISIRYISPILERGVGVAVVVGNRCRIVGRGASPPR